MWLEEGATLNREAAPSECEGGLIGAKSSIAERVGWVEQQNPQGEHGKSRSGKRGSAQVGAGALSLWAAIVEWQNLYPTLKVDGMILSVKDRLDVEVEEGVQAGTGAHGSWWVRRW